MVSLVDGRWAKPIGLGVAMVQIRSEPLVIKGIEPCRSAVCIYVNGQNFLGKYILVSLYFCGAQGA